MNTPETPSSIDQIPMPPVEAEPQFTNRLKVTLIGGPFVVAIGGAEATHELVFPAHKDYDKIHSQIDSDQQQIASLQQAKQSIKLSPNSQAVQQINHKVHGLRADIGVANTKFPDGYNHHVDSAISMLGGFGAFVVSAVVLRKLALRHLQKAPARTAK